jgi:hypothetical protein
MFRNVQAPSAFPDIALADLDTSEAAFKLIEPLVRTNAPNSVNGLER